MIFFLASSVEIQFCSIAIKILSRQIHNVRVVQSLDLESPALRMAQIIRVVLFIFIWTWNPPYTELLLRFTFSTYFEILNLNSCCQWSKDIWKNSFELSKSYQLLQIWSFQNVSMFAQKNFNQIFFQIFFLFRMFKVIIMFLNVLKQRRV